MKQKYRIRKYDSKQLLFAVLDTVICAIVAVFAAMIKFYLTGVAITVNFALCAVYVLILVAAFYGGLLMFVMISRSFIIKNNRYYRAFLVAMTFAFVYRLFISLISPLLMAPGLAAMIIVQLTRKKQDAFVFNLIETCMTLCMLLYEAIMTDGEVFMVIGGEETTSLHLWLLTVISVMSVCVGAFIPVALRDSTSRLHGVFVGLLVTGASVVLYILMALSYSDISLVLSYFWLVMIAGVTPIVLSQFAVPVLEKAFDLVTDNRLIELTDTRQPLLRRLATEAPGTYNHSLAVANFAEMCANAIGEDPYLARAAAYYHDVGKLSNPFYFAENQAGYNPHDDILPEVSAEIVRKHTTEGYKLCREYGLPEEVARVTVQHHGTLPMAVFYERAKRLTDGEVDIRDYSYHGTCPTNRISAIIMICDSSEAAIRAMDHPDGERVDRLLRGIIADRISRGQFDNCPISLMELDIIRQTIISAYGGLFHHRIKYPGGEKQ